MVKEGNGDAFFANLCLFPTLNNSIMKKNLFIIVFSLVAISLHAQNGNETQRKSLTKLIDQYSEARAKSDTVLLKSILTSDIDQLVSTGEWRNGIKTAVKGMLNSSATNSGTRTLTVDKIKMLTGSCAIVDCRYEIQEANGSMRKMWSTFIAVSEKGKWKISAIRNMLPSPQ
jgi:hypothetical protein